MKIYVLVTIDRLDDDHMGIFCYENEELANKAKDEAKNNYHNDKLFLSAYIHEVELMK